jgi:hypothetical protein
MQPRVALFDEPRRLVAEDKGALVQVGRVRVIVDVAARIAAAAHAAEPFARADLVDILALVADALPDGGRVVLVFGWVALQSAQAGLCVEECRAKVAILWVKRVLGRGWKRGQCHGGLLLCCRLC